MNRRFISIDCLCKIRLEYLGKTRKSKNNYTSHMCDNENHSRTIIRKCNIRSSWLINSWLSFPFERQAILFLSSMKLFKIVLNFTIKSLVFVFIKQNIKCVTQESMFVFCFECQYNMGGWLIYSYLWSCPWVTLLTLLVQMIFHKMHTVQELKKILACLKI